MLCHVAQNLAVSRQIVQEHRARRLIGQGAGGLLQAGVGLLEKQRCTRIPVGVQHLVAGEDSHHGVFEPNHACHVQIRQDLFYLGQCGR